MSSSSDFLLGLPPELLCQVIGYLDRVRDRGALARTCSFMRRCVAAQWREMLLRWGMDAPPCCLTRHLVCLYGARRKFHSLLIHNFQDNTTGLRNKEIVQVGVFLKRYLPQETELGFPNGWMDSKAEAVPFEGYARVHTRKKFCSEPVVLNVSRPGYELRLTIDRTGTVLLFVTLYNVSFSGRQRRLIQTNRLEANLFLTDLLKQALRPSRRACLELGPLFRKLALCERATVWTSVNTGLLVTRALLPPRDTKQKKSGKRRRSPFPRSQDEPVHIPIRWAGTVHPSEPFSISYLPGGEIRGRVVLPRRHITEEEPPNLWQESFFPVPWFPETLCDALMKQLSPGSGEPFLCPGCDPNEPPLAKRQRRLT